ncbi:DUF6479 family protein [Streptomyces sp. NPDC057445]|uniref:DUF6479 family protein n=1 Tax=Streptomyces sp. NPDC057445 TaxID=3346136 RepID=UPI0036835F2E
MNALESAQQLSVTGASTEVAGSPLLGGIGPLVAGIVIVVVLIVAVRWGIKRRATEPPPPRPEEQPVPPAHRSHIEENREPDEDLFPEDGGRLTPHELKGHSSRPAPVRGPGPDENGGGSHGSGGAGG